uniref:Uncharacterized protein n=1 Tax=Ditylenchus dipsaci TaxID=166011 RepID=A0A915D7L9_9BILA
MHLAGMLFTVLANTFGLNNSTEKAEVPQPVHFQLGCHFQNMYTNPSVETMFSHLLFTTLFVGDPGTNYRMIVDDYIGPILHNNSYSWLYERFFDPVLADKTRVFASGISKTFTKLNQTHQWLSIVNTSSSVTFNQLGKDIFKLENADKNTQRFYHFADGLINLGLSSENQSARIITYWIEPTNTNQFVAQPRPALLTFGGQDPEHCDADKWWYTDQLVNQSASPLNFNVDPLQTYDNRPKDQVEMIARNVGAVKSKASTSRFVRPCADIKHDVEVVFEVKDGNRIVLKRPTTLFRIQKMPKPVCLVKKYFESKKGVNDQLSETIAYEFIGTMQVCAPMFDVNFVLDTYGLSGVLFEIALIEIVNALLLRNAIADPCPLFHGFLKGKSHLPSF